MHGHQVDHRRVRERREQVPQRRPGVASQKDRLTSASGELKGAWEGTAADEWTHRIDIVANQVEQGVADDISSVGDLLDDVAQGARALRGKAEALPASLGGSGDSGGARLVLDDGAAGGVRGDVTTLGEALGRVEPAIADIRGILSQLRTCSLSVDDAAEAAVKDAKGKLETFSGDWDVYLSGVSSLVDKITAGMSKLDPNELAMRENAMAKAVANYARATGAAAAMRGLATSSCAYGGDPVNMVTGNFIYPELDLRLGGAPGASVERMYNSDSPEVGLFGLGWSSTLDECLAFDGALVTHLRPDGRRRAFAPSGDGDVWKTVDEVEETITRRRTPTSSSARTARAGSSTGPADSPRCATFWASPPSCGATGPGVPSASRPAVVAGMLTLPAPVRTSCSSATISAAR